jgi:predicted DNA-binding protein YlxM (UPF0122 family)
MPKDLRFSLLLEYYGSLLNEKQAEMVSSYYDLDLSLSEIAENEGITRQGAHDQIKRAEAKLLEWEEKCRYAEKFLKLKELSQDSENFTEIKKIINDL